jgi:transcriptional antiterminator NusG
MVTALSDPNNNPREEPALAAGPAVQKEATSDSFEKPESGDEQSTSQVDESKSASTSVVAEEKAAPEPPRKRWYVVKVQSGREDTIKEAIERRVRKEGLEEYFGQIIIPVEKQTEVKTDKNGKRITRTKEVKLYPGYLMVEVEYNDRILYLFRETSGVGDFVGARPGDLTRAPTPMSEKEVQKMLGPTKAGEQAASNIPTKPAGLEVGDRVKVIDGTFNGMDGIVRQILEAVGKVQVELTIFGRPVNVDLDYYQVESI